MTTPESTLMYIAIKQEGGCDMGFWAWLEGKLSTGKTVEVTADTIEQFVDQERLYNLVVEELKVHAAINLIVNSF